VKQRRKINMDKAVKIDTNKCIGCGLCVADCPYHALSLQNKKSTVIKSQCLFCGHCEAICPKNAITIQGYDQSQIIKNNNESLNYDDLMNHIKLHRTIRHYSSKEIEKEKIDQIIQAGRYSKTGSNSQNVRYIVLDKDIDNIEKLGIKQYKKLKMITTPFRPFLKPAKALASQKLEKGFLFCGSRKVILVVSKNKVNASLAASNMELAAESLGLGILYTGLFIRVANAKKIRKALGIKGKERIVVGLALGYPASRYQRSTYKDQANISEY